MQKFLYKIVEYILCFFLFSLLCLLVTSIMAHKKIIKKGRGIVIDKNTRLNSLTSPKIILASGSNVCYGIDSQTMEDSLNMPTVDMAINGNIGMVFYYNQLKHSLKEGDIVIGIPEYTAYLGENMMGNSGTYALGIIESKNFSYLTNWQWLRFPLYIGDLIKDNYTTILASESSKMSNGRSLYNKYGDYIGHKNDSSHSWSFRNQHTGSSENQSDLVDKKFAELIESFATFCKQRGILYLHAYPVYAKPYFSPNFVKNIKASLPNINWIGTPEEYLYNFEDMYDSPNHILYNKIGDRTHKLVNNIKQYIQKNVTVKK